MIPCASSLEAWSMVVGASTSVYQLEIDTVELQAVHEDIGTCVSVLASLVV